MNVDVFLNVFSLRLCAWFLTPDGMGGEVTAAEKNGKLWKISSVVHVKRRRSCGGSAYRCDRQRSSIPATHQGEFAVGAQPGVRISPQSPLQGCGGGQIIHLPCGNFNRVEGLWDGPKTPPAGQIPRRGKGSAAQVMLRAETQPALSYRLGSARRRGGEGVSQSIWCRPTNS